jgi:hypothetical protein
MSAATDVQTINWEGRDSMMHNLDLGLPNGNERKTASEQICLELQLCIIGSNHRSIKKLQQELTFSPWSAPTPKNPPSGYEKCTNMCAAKTHISTHVHTLVSVQQLITSGPLLMVDPSVVVYGHTQRASMEDPNWCPPPDLMCMTKRSSHGTSCWGVALCQNTPGAVNSGFVSFESSSSAQ